MDPNSAILVKGVSKSFALPHERATSIKGMFVAPIRALTGKRSKEKRRLVLNDIGFKVNKGEFFGIVGRNGSGKSTLLKIIAGIYQPSRGSVKINGRLVPFIELGVGFNPELSGEENVYLNGSLLGFSRKEVKAKYDDIVDFAELSDFMKEKLKNYSSGMQVRLAFSVATKLAESDVLLVDEVLAVGDASFQKKCFDYFKSAKRQGKTVIFVSHDMEAVEQYCDKAILLDGNRIVAEGRSREVAQKYRELFIDTKIAETKDHLMRWGDMQCRIKRIKIPKYIRDSALIQLEMCIESKYKIDDLVIGFEIKNSDGQTVTGTNSFLNNNRKLSIEKNSDTIVQWSVPNIFSDGDYRVDIALVHSYTTVSDWWQGAGFFKVLKKQSTPHLTSPEIVFNIYDTALKRLK